MSAKSPTVASLAPAAPRKRGCGCLKGCALGCVVLVVLLLGATAAGSLYAKRWVGERLPAWEERFPALEVVRGLLEIKRGISEIGDDVPLTAQGGITDPAALPDDIPRLRSPETEAVSIGEDFVVLYQEVADTPSEAAAAARRAAVAKGWRLLDDETWGERGRYLTFSKGDDRCVIEILSGPDGTEVWLDVTRVRRTAPA